MALAATLGSSGPHAALLGIVSAWDGVLGAERELCKIWLEQTCQSCQVCSKLIGRMIAFDRTCGPVIYALFMLNLRPTSAKFIQ